MLTEKSKIKRCGAAPGVVSAAAAHLFHGLTITDTLLNTFYPFSIFQTILCKLWMCEKVPADKQLLKYSDSPSGNNNHDTFKVV